MDWSAVAAIATTIAAFGAVVSVLVALWLSPPMQKCLHRHDTFKQLQPYERDILKAILCSRLGLGCILIRKGSIDPVIEVALSDYGNLSEGRVLIVGQSFYQLSLESFESLGLLRAVKVIRHTPLPLPKGQTPPEHRAYRITGKGTQFIQKYENDLREKSYKGCYIDLTSSNSVVTRYKAWILIPNPPKDTDGRREDSGRGVRELQARLSGLDSGRREVAGRPAGALGGADGGLRWARGAR